MTGASIRSPTSNFGLLRSAPYLPFGARTITPDRALSALMQMDSELGATTGRDYWTLMAGFLGIGSVLLIAAAVVQSLGYGGASILDRLYAIAEQSSVLPPILVVGAVAMLA